MLQHLDRYRVGQNVGFSRNLELKPLGKSLNRAKAAGCTDNCGAFSPSQTAVTTPRPHGLIGSNSPAPSLLTFAAPQSTDFWVNEEPHLNFCDKPRKLSFTLSQFKLTFRDFATFNSLATFTTQLVNFARAQPQRKKQNLSSPHIANRTDCRCGIE